MRKQNALSIFDEMGEMFEELFPVSANNMKSDVKELENEYVIDIELPGYKKEEVSVDYNEGYLTVKASHNDSSEDKKHKYIRQEIRRSMQERSYYVGDIEEEKVKAKMENGILELRIPKVEALPEKTNQILIE